MTLHKKLASGLGALAVTALTAMPAWSVVRVEGTTFAAIDSTVFVASPSGTPSRFAYTVIWRWRACRSIWLGPSDGVTFTTFDRSTSCPVFERTFRLLSPARPFFSLSGRLMVTS